ncbi:RAMP superfamily CRISPR-associated protein [Metallosphaera hakonensis]|nr:RAMP superfamily CRISPR-associated protein [Metallosphaera hakonensis]
MKVLPVVVETKSVTRIGSTGVYFDYSAADIMTYKIPLQVDNNQLYYIPAIPATSFKGVLRSTYERFLRKRMAPNAPLVNEAEIRKALSSAPSRDNDLMKDLMKDLCKEINLFHDAGLLTEKCEIKEEGNYNEEKLVKYLDLYFEVTGRNASESCYVTSDLDQCVNMSLIEDERKRREKSLWNKITRRENICKVCNLLGTSGVRGYVKFTDLVAVDPFPILLERETHVAINRVTGTSEKSKLFTEEIIPAGVKFLGFILILDDTKLEQITEALNDMKEKARFGEIWIGGRGTSGYGSFELHFNEEVKFSEYSLLQGRS